VLLVLDVRIQGTPLIFGIPLAFLGGFLSFVSPCVAPLVPGYIGYLAGTSVSAGSAPRRLLLLNGLAFVLGFSAVFTVVGIAIGQLLTNVQSAQGYVRWGGGVVIIILGFHTLGLVRIPFLDRTVRIQPGTINLGGERDLLGIVARPRTAPERGDADALPVASRRGTAFTFGRSFLIGTVFAAGWSPCVGPILTGIYGVVGSQPANGGILLFVYSLGLGVPFLWVAMLFGKASSVLRRVNRYHGAISIASGLFLIGIGILLLTDTMARLAQYAPPISLPGVS